MGNTPSTQREEKEQKPSNGGLKSRVSSGAGHQAGSGLSSLHTTFTSTDHHHQQPQSHPPSHPPRQPSLSSTTAQPSASFENANALPASHSRPSASDVLRSQAIAATTTPHLAPKPASTSASSPSYYSNPLPIMGNNQSRHADGSAKSQPSPKNGPRPIAAPAVSDSHSKRSEHIVPIASSITPMSEDGFWPASELYGPPRLPLPISTEERIPGSPVLLQADLNNDGTDVDPLNIDRPPPKPSSILSDKTNDYDEQEQEAGDGPVGQMRGVMATIPTLFEWRGPGEKVFLTGSFVEWDKKLRLYKK